MKQEGTIYYERFSLNIANIFTRDKNIANSCREEIKQNMLWKKIIILKGKITIIYIEHKHENTEISVLIHPQNVEKQYH